MYETKLLRADYQSINQSMGSLYSFNVRKPSLQSLSFSDFKTAILDKKLQERTLKLFILNVFMLLVYCLSTKVESYADLTVRRKRHISDARTGKVERHPQISERCQTRSKSTRQIKKLLGKISRRLDPWKTLIVAPAISTRSSDSALSRHPPTSKGKTTRGRKLARKFNVIFLKELVYHPRELGTQHSYRQNRTKHHSI